MVQCVKVKTGHFDLSYLKMTWEPWSSPRKTSFVVRKGDQGGDATDVVCGFGNRIEEDGMATRRAFLGALGAGVVATRGGAVFGAEGRGQQDVPVRKVKTTPLFKSPEGYPNAIA